MSTSEDKPPFIHDQGWKLLTVTSNPREYLKPEYFRAGRQAELREGLDPLAWKPIEDKKQIVLNNLTDWQEQPVDLKRMVVTTDGGMGKSIAVDWLQYLFNQASQQCVALKLDLEKLNLSREQSSQDLLHELALQFRDKIEAQPDVRSLDIATAKEILTAYRRLGRLVIFLDGLDQSSSSTESLQSILTSPAWRPARFVIAGRVEAVNKHWELLADKSWRFLCVSPFTKAQQIRFLGRLPDGSGRYAKVVSNAPSAKPILSIPRVLKYLRRQTDFSKISSAASVFYYAVENLIEESMRNDPDSRRIGIRPGNKIPQRVQSTSQATALEMLGAIAFETLTYLDSEPSNPPSKPGDRPPGYRDSVDKEIYKEFEKRLAARIEELKTQGDFVENMAGLGHLNVALDREIFDMADKEGFNRIHFSNRGLFDFLVAYYLAQHSRPADLKWLWDRIYIADQNDTEYFYYIWQYLCEMPKEARNPLKWLGAIEPLFHPCLQDGEGNYFAKRSPEMMFRCWKTLAEYCQNKERAIAAEANRIRERFWGEFESEILSGHQGTERKGQAEEIKNSLISLPGDDSFKMGTPVEKQGVTPEQTETVNQLIESSQADPQAFAAEILADVPFFGMEADDRKAATLQGLADLLRQRDAAAIAQLFWPSDETPKGKREQKVTDFQLSRQAVSNAWFRLFDPDFGLRRSSYADYAKYSPSAGHPAIFITWYAAFIYCEWLRWRGHSCHLPYEKQWEYAAKFGQDPDGKYWWGDKPDFSLLNCAESKNGTTTVPSPEHVNPATRDPSVDPLQIGLMDMLGNTWEWCQDHYQEAYDFDPSDYPGDAARARCLRGGSFLNDADDARCSLRVRNDPTYANRSRGFRVARA